MSDLELVANRKKSFVIVKTGVAAEKMGEWKQLCGNMVALIDYVSTSQPELLNALKSSGCDFCYDDKMNYDKVSKSIDTTGLEVNDFSGDVSEEYLRALSDSAVKCVVATTADDLLQYHRVNPLLRVSVRLSLSGKMYDSGISVEEAPAFFEVAKSNGIEIDALCIDCPSAASVKPALEMLQSVKAVAASKGIAIGKFVLLNEGVQELLKSEECAPILSELKELANSIRISADASRFFTQDAYTIYTIVIGKKKKTSEKEERMLYYVDNGVYCCFYSAHINGEFSEFVPIHVVSKPSEKQYITTLFGPTCDSIDTLGNDYHFPELMIGDWLKAEHSGYKCSNDSARFNGFEDPDIIVM